MKKVLIFLRLVDEHDLKLSLTNVAVIIVLAKIALVQQAGLTELGSLLVAMVGYNYKKYINQNATTDPLSEQVESMVKKISEIESKTASLALAAGFKPRG